MACVCLEVVPGVGYHLRSGYHLGTTYPQICGEYWENDGTRGWGTTWVPVGTGCEVVPTAPYTPYGGGAGTTPGYHQTASHFYQPPSRARCTPAAHAKDHVHTINHRRSHAQSSNPHHHLRNSGSIPCVCADSCHQVTAPAYIRRRSFTKNRLPLLAQRHQFTFTTPHTTPIGEESSYSSLHEHTFDHLPSRRQRCPQ